MREREIPLDQTPDFRLDGQTALVIVPDYQLSLAIGKEGQNARLSARLTGLRVDIKSESQTRKEAEDKESNNDGQGAVSVPARQSTSAP